jgi:MarR family transcriptional regulator, transcriptional regulator for hemolysin
MQDSTSGQWSPAKSVSFWVNRASRVLTRLQDSRIRPLGFGMSQMPVLHALQGGAVLSQKELAARANVEQPSMAELLARMERDGVVERAPDPDDGRGTLTSLTRSARARLPKAKEVLLETERDALAGFSSEEKELLLALLQRVVRNLEA